MTKMLVVDDEVEICSFLKDFFEQRGFCVSTAYNGEAALSVCEKERPAVVLLDIRMPGQDGIEVLKKIKRQFPGTKVIMVTAVESPDKIEEATREGADNYITKPLSLEYLENDVREKLAKLTG